jgi:ABC-type lipoprotein release transport system permease subunit
MMESLLLSLFGTLLGLALAFGAIKGLQTMHIEGIPRQSLAVESPG